MTHRHLLGALALAFAFTTLTIAPTQVMAKGNFINVGVEPFIVLGGSANFESSDANVGKVELKDLSSTGVTAYALFTIIPLALDAGVVIHHLPTIKLATEEDVTTEFGSESDLNLRLRFNIPTPYVSTAIRAEGGLTSFSPGSDYTRTLDGVFEEKDSPFGFNFGAGAEVKYAVIPLLSVGLGLDFQYYNFQTFEGTKPSSLVDSGERVDDLSGNRFKISLGIHAGF